MRSNARIIIIIIIIFITVILFVKFILTPGRWQPKLVNPGFLGKTQQVAEPTITPTPKPKQFKFDSSTNLEQEADSVDPQVKNEDFEELKKLVDSI